MRVKTFKKKDLVAWFREGQVRHTDPCGFLSQCDCESSHHASNFLKNASLESLELLESRKQQDTAISLET